MKQCIRVQVDITSGMGPPTKYKGFWVDTVSGHGWSRAVVISDSYTVDTVALEALTVQATSFQLQSDRVIYNTLEEK